MGAPAGIEAGGQKTSQGPHRPSAGAFVPTLDLGDAWIFSVEHYAIQRESL